MLGCFIRVLRSSDPSHGLSQKHTSLMPTQHRYTSNQPLQKQHAELHLSKRLLGLYAEQAHTLRSRPACMHADCTQSAVGFGNALWRLHVTMFTSYRDWASHERFDAFVHTGSYSMHTHEPAAILTGLLDLATYFCLWTEASTLRHMPESLWFFFWCDFYASPILSVLPAISKRVPENSP